MTAKQKRFCQEYIIDLNATQAAIRSGYSKKTATVIGYEHLIKPHISEYIQLLKDKREERTQITGDMVIKELALIAFQDAANLVDETDSLKTIHGMGSDISRTIAEVTNRVERGNDGDVSEIIKVKTYDKKGALDSLGKHFGIFEKDNSQSNPETVKEIVVKFVSAKDGD